MVSKHHDVTKENKTFHLLNTFYRVAEEGHFYQILLNWNLAHSILPSTDFTTDYSRYYFLHENEFLLDTRDIILVFSLAEYAAYPFQSFGEKSKGTKSCSPKWKSTKKRMAVPVVIIKTNSATSVQVELFIPCHNLSMH